MQKTSSINHFLIVFSLLFSLSIDTTAEDHQPTQANLKFSSSTYYGSYIARPETMLPFDQTPYIGQELRVGYQTDGKQYWHQALNYPYYGLGLYTGKYLDNYKGNLYGGFLFIDIPILTFGKSSIETSLGMGVTLHCNSYNIPEDPTFMQGSSYANVYSHIALGYLYTINSHFNVGGGVRFQHFSNGGWQYPNNGLEMPSAEVKVQYTPKGITKTSNSKTPQTEGLPLTLCYVAGISGSDVNLNEKFFNTTLSLAYNAIEKPCYGLSIGLDATYNGYINEEQSPSTVSNYDVYSSGLFVSNELIAGRCRIGLQVGTYIYNGQAFISPLYERLTIRYQIKKKPFLHFGIKLNGANSQFLEWGFGYKL